MGRYHGATHTILPSKLVETWYYWIELDWIGTVWRGLHWREMHWMGFEGVGVD